MYAADNPVEQETFKVLQLWELSIMTTTNKQNIFKIKLLSN